jgi:hypothetical protein
VDFAAYPFASDPRLWSEDRLHANSLGHARIAEALAHVLGLPDSSANWAQPFPEPLSQGLRKRLLAELHWTRGYLLPWLWRHATGRSSGDGITAKRPTLLAMNESEHRS